MPLNDEWNSWAGNDGEANVLTSALQQYAGSRDIPCSVISSITSSFHLTPNFCACLNKQLRHLGSLFSYFAKVHRGCVNAATTSVQGWKKGDERDVYKKKTTKQCVPWWCVTLHVLYTRLALKSILYMSFTKKERRKKMVSGHQELVVSPFLFSLRTFTSVAISVSDA